MRADKRRKKKGKGPGKSTFKVMRPRVGLRKGKSPKGESPTPTMYGGYDLAALDVPREAYPDLTRENVGKHSYTLKSPNSSARIEVFLRPKAFFVKRVSDTGPGPTGQLSWLKCGGAKAAWIESSCPAEWLHPLGR